MLGQKILKNGIEVYKVKIEVTGKLPPPTSVKGISDSLGHMGSYSLFSKTSLELQINCPNYYRRR